MSGELLPEGPMDGGGYHDLGPHMVELASLVPGADAVTRYQVHRWARRWYGWQCTDGTCVCDCACCRRRKGRAR